MLGSLGYIEGASPAEIDHVPNGIIRLGAVMRLASNPIFRSGTTKEISLYTLKYFKLFYVLNHLSSIL